jgi:hypothetical protein
MKIGDIVEIEYRLRRLSKYENCSLIKCWGSYDFEKPKKEKCIFLGWRTVSDGVAGAFEWSYAPKRNYKVALVKAFDNTNPFYARLKLEDKK